VLESSDALIKMVLRQFGLSWDDSCMIKRRAVGRGLAWRSV